VGFAASILQYPLFWAILDVIASGGAVWTWALTLGVWAIRALAVTGIDRALRGMPGGLAFRSPVWLLPSRDLLSVAEWIASFAGRRVDWRGLKLEADTPSPLTPRELTANDAPQVDFNPEDLTPEDLANGSHAR
jgi:ceramide glucosyltransferase